jgi:outer membrane protein assembly factor BamE
MSVKSFKRGVAALVPVPRPWREAAGLVAALALAGCGSLNDAGSRVASVVTPYKVEVVQGNFVSREQVAALQPGMPRAQVRDILGTPLLTSVFHGERWDYVFTLRRQGVEAQARRLAVFFKADALDHFEGDEMPTEAEFVSRIDTRRTLGKVPVLEVSEEVLRDFSAKNPAAPAPTVSASQAPLPAVYPPLEAAVVGEPAGRNP